MSRSMLATSALLLASATHGASADDRLAFQGVERPTVTRAADVVQVPASRVDFGTQLIFTQLQTPRAAEIRRQGFQIRIFSVPENDPIPRPARQIDDCNIYFSNVFTVYGGTSPSIAFDLMDERWMDLSNSKRNVLNGHYLLVFEALGVSDRVFRLHKDDAAEYFATGISFTVDGAGRASLEKVKAAYELRNAERVQLQNDLGRRGDQIPCYRYRRLTPGVRYTQAALEVCRS